MPPKKKQEEIDISTLPQCFSSNCIILCRGRKQRSQNILNKIFTQYKSLITKISRQEVLDHAKQKNIYVDPNTLNDKQKKDQKFMESICTQLNPSVIAKATKSLIDQLNIKIRLQLKAQNEKPQNQRPKSIFQKKLDQLYLFSQQFFESKQQLQAMAAIKENLKYFFFINPAISWNNAPQITEQQNEEPEEEDQQIKQLRELKAREVLKQEDKVYNEKIDKKVQEFIKFRRESSSQSQFRNCIIDSIDCEIDPYNEETSLNELNQQFINRLSKLNSQYDEFLQWKKDKSTINIVDKQLSPQSKQQKASIEKQTNYKNQKTPHKNSLSSTSQILTQFVDTLFSTSHSIIQDDDDFQTLVNGFSFDRVSSNINQNDHPPYRKDKKSQFFSQNQNLNSNLQNKLLQQNLKSNLNYPGINRFLMPSIPLKSQSLRKLNRSHNCKFLHQNLPDQQFQRRLNLLKFQEILKQMDQERKYSLNQRIYEQYHDQKSLMRELYRAMSINQQAHLLTKYNQQNDKLYLVLLYKNNQRRSHSKLWESSWKVLPNYQSWLKYFKENENNFNTQTFYDIDYQKIGHINDQVNVFSISDGGVIIKKKSVIGNKQNEFLYGIKNHHLFGLNQKMFYSQNKSTKINYFLTSENEYETQILIGNQMELRIKNKSGDIAVQIAGQQRRMYTPNGYTIIYEGDSVKNYKILHPTGGISEKNGYINETGLGVKNEKIQSVPALLRRTDDYEIVKRDDETVIVKDNNKKWIKFYEGTEYLIQQEEIWIQKKNFPFVSCKNDTIRMEINDLTIIGQKNPNNQSYLFTIKYTDGNELLIDHQQIKVMEANSHIPYLADINQNQFTINMDTQQLIISSSQAQYLKNGISFNPLQSQDTFSDDQILPSDFIQPKLYIISPDNTGIQFISEKQLQYYYSLKTNQKNNAISSIKRTNHSQNIHIVSRVIQNSQMNPKRINLNFNIDLDIFKTQKIFKQKSLVEKFTVRSLIKNKNLLPEDRQEIQQIVHKREQWIKKLRKEQNEFGHKQKEDQWIEQLKKDKKIMIDFRKKEMHGVDFQELKHEAISEWKFKQKQHLTLVAQKEEEDKIKLRLRQKKKSIVQNYPQLVLKSKEVQQQADNYSSPGFYVHYFETHQGKKALAAMPDWVFRPKTAKAQKQLDPQILTQLNNTMNKTKKQQQDKQLEQRERYDTVNVQLNPVRQIYIKPSVFTQRQIDQQRDAFQHQKKAYFYHEKKRKQFNLYGQERKDKIEVKSLLRTQPISQINQKYLITEAPLDKKIKISSMKNKLTSQASSLAQMRKEGPHNTLLKTLDKRNDYNTLLQKRTMMVHADLNDKLQRDILITPVEVQFGYLKEGKSYELRINVKNQDILAQRLVVKKARNLNVKVMMSEMGPIALGMSRKIIVQIKASSQFLGKFTDEFQIVSKHQIYKIPVIAHILSQTHFDNQNVKLSQNVKEIPQSLKRKQSSLPPIN